MNKYALLWLVALLPGCALSQPTTANPGDQVRIRLAGPASTEADEVEGWIGALERQHLTVTEPSGVEVVVPYTEMRSWHVLAGRRGHEAKGAGIGFLLGVPTGIVLTEGTLLEHPLTGVVTGGVGALLGLIVGEHIRTDRWVEQPLVPRVIAGARLEARPPRGWQLRLSVPAAASRRHVR